MAYILQLETSTDVCSVAISASGSTISIVESLDVSVTDPDLIPRLEWDHLLQRVFVIH